MHRIHVTGASPRTGTTLIAEAMVACFNIDLYEAHEARIFAQPTRVGNIYLTKSPRDILLAEKALAKSPDTWVVFMLRDPRNIVVSKHRRDPTRYWAGLKFWKTYIPCARRLWQHERFVVVRYESLLADPDAVQRELTARMPFLVETESFSRYHEVARPSTDAVDALNGIRPIAAEQIDPWRAHLPRLAGQLAQHGSISADLIEFGYETDEEWEDALHGVTPDLTPSRWPEFFTEQSLRRMLRAP